MNQIIEMLKQQVEAFPSMKQPFEWMLDNAVVVKVNSYKEHPIVKQAVEHFLNHNEIYLKACYANAYAMASMLPQKDFNSSGVFKYVLGQAPGIIAVDHAWNSFDGFHFDLTNEILHKGKAFAPEYVMFKDFSSDEVSTIIDEIHDFVPDIWTYLNLQRRKSDQIH